MGRILAIMALLSSILITTASPSGAQLADESPFSGALSDHELPPDVSETPGGATTATTEGSGELERGESAPSVSISSASGCTTSAILTLSAPPNSLSYSANATFCRTSITTRVCVQLQRKIGVRWTNVEVERCSSWSRNSYKSTALRFWSCTGAKGWYRSIGSVDIRPNGWDSPRQSIEMFCG